MPFISKDWRSPGEEWVKTEEGWEKKRILECCHHPEHEGIDESRLEEKSKLPSESCEDNLALEQFVEKRRKTSDGAVQPHCQITIKSTREIAGFNGLSDALKRLDFRSAVHDIRRFNYTAKLLEMLMTQRLAMLPGCAQRVLFAMLEEVASHVCTSQQNIHTLRRLLGQLRATLDHACWGWPLGSSLLWERHLRSIDKVAAIASHIRIREPRDDAYPKLVDLPEECVREVLLRLDDHKDLESSGQAYGVMQRLVDEQRIWRELCRFHFTPLQLQHVTEGALAGCTDWQRIYHKLRRLFGLKEEYAEMIQLCRNCRCLFWKSIGHPCIADQDPEFQEKLEDVDKDSLHVPVPPHMFLKFFSL
ncbi:F-box only protein 32 [Bacillus rossius redtenbacheri]|uniref:F-box only protein 32 n=1 Tax=Bacillus rossius redtenbacheri TaxID=93214 RepID=UPI002FDDAC7D